MNNGRIMVIEDNSSVRENLLTLLIEEGFEVISAVNGEIALQILANEIPSLIVCDILMPKISGFEFYSKLLENENTASIPLIFLTAKADKEAITTAQSMGAARYIVKPFRIEELLRSIKEELNVI